MDDADAVLMRAWALSLENHTDEIQVQLEAMLPILVASGYAEAKEHIWSFTPEGVGRAEELERRSSIT